MNWAIRLKSVTKYKAVSDVREVMHSYEFYNIGENRSIWKGQLLERMLLHFAHIIVGGYLYFFKNTEPF